MKQEYSPHRAKFVNAWNVSRLALRRFSKRREDCAFRFGRLQIERVGVEIEVARPNNASAAGANLHTGEESVLGQLLEQAALFNRRIEVHNAR